MRSGAFLGARPRAEAAPSWLAAPLVLTLIALALFGIRLAGRPNLLDNEYRLGACVLNAIQGGNWISPHDSLGNVDKPPMLTWLSALASLPTGQVTRFTLYLPTALATLAVALLVCAAGRRHFGWRAGFFAGLACVLSHVAAQEMGTARWDGLFAFTVVLTAFAAFRAWISGRGWTAFWVAAAVATLTKGPLGLLLGAFGLCAVSWERRSGRPWPLRGSHGRGVAVFLFTTIGWLAAAGWQMGPHLITNMLGTELVGHMVMRAPGHRLTKPLLDFLGGFAPWSALAAAGLWRIWAFPSEDDRTRRFERFVFCWFVGGLLIFCISPHNPSRLLWPIMPPAALIAGRELDRFMPRFQARRGRAIAAALILTALTGLALQQRGHERRSHKAAQTLAMFDLSRQVGAAVGKDFPLTYVRDVPFAMQLTLDTMRPTVTFAEAAALLRGDAPVYVVVRNVTRLRRALRDDRRPLHEVAACSVGSDPYLHILSNRPRLEWSDSMAIGLGSLRVQLSGVHLGATQDGEIVVKRGSRAGSVAVVNGASEAANVALRVIGGAERRESRRLAGGASWDVGVE